MNPDSQLIINLPFNPNSQVNVNSTSIPTCKLTSSLKSSWIKLRLTKARKEVKLNAWPKVKSRDFSRKRTLCPLNFGSILEGRKFKGELHSKKIKTLSLKSNFLSQKERPSRLICLFQKERKTSEDPEWREQGHEECPQPRRSTPKSRTFSIERKDLKIPREENKHTKCALNPKDQPVKSKIEIFK